MLGGSRFASTGGLHDYRQPYAASAPSGSRFGSGVNVGHASMATLTGHHRQQQHSYAGSILSQVSGASRSSPRQFTLGPTSSAPSGSYSPPATAPRTRSAVAPSTSASPAPAVERLSVAARERRGCGNSAHQQSQMHSHRIPSSSPRAEGLRYGVSLAPSRSPVCRATAGAGSSPSASPIRTTSPSRGARGSGAVGAAGAGRRSPGTHSPSRGRSGMSSETEPHRTQQRKAQSQSATAPATSPVTSLAANAKSHTVSAPSSATVSSARSKTPTSGRAYEPAAAQPPPRTAASETGGSRRVGSPPPFSTTFLSSRVPGSSTPTSAAPEPAPVRVPSGESFAGCRALVDNELAAVAAAAVAEAADARTIKNRQEAESKAAECHGTSIAPRACTVPVPDVFLPAFYQKKAAETETEPMQKCITAAGDSAAGPSTSKVQTLEDMLMRTATPSRSSAAQPPAAQRVPVGMRFDVPAIEDESGETVTAPQSTVISPTGASIRSGASAVVTLSSASTSTVDLHCNRSGLQRSSSAAESVCSNGGNLELSDSLFSSSNSQTSSAGAIGVAVASQPQIAASAITASRIALSEGLPVRRQGGDNDVLVSGAAAKAKRRSRTPEPPAYRRELDLQAGRSPSGGSKRRSRTSGGHREQDENAPPAMIIQDGAAYEAAVGVDNHLKNGGAKERAAGSVKLMKSFWETKMQEKTNTRASSVDGCSRRASLVDIAIDGRMSIASSAAPTCRHGGGSVPAFAQGRGEKLKRNLKNEMAKQWKYQEQIAERIRSLCGDSEVDDLGETSQLRSSESDSSVLNTMEDDEDVAFLNSFEETNKSLWRAQRQTMRLLLQCVDKNIAMRSRSPLEEPHEPAGEPDAGDVALLA